MKQVLAKCGVAFISSVSCPGKNVHSRFQPLCAVTVLTIF